MSLTKSDCCCPFVLDPPRDPKQQGLDWEQYLVEGVRTDVDLSGLRDDDGVSGRGKSEDGKLSYGYTSRRGHRVTMDGHFGARAAKYLKPHLFDILMKHPQLMTNTKLAMSMLNISNDVLLEMGLNY
ncbi:hypothetical protein F383_01436 [Gossypium arboreum]|uniref:Uncharacterized protein n=1 Tax=Gossypium arboreum TaxID=29729 RepID=A0A0B0PK15_GOSAR|nr:hypothetical protein F383_01436 [Gossypium arboreum]